jgi:GTP-binding protein LepA
MCERLKDLIPRHLFKIPIQAAIGGRSSRGDDRGAAQRRGGEMLQRRCDADAEAAREAEGGGKKMREYGSVSIPQEAFMATLRMGDEG